MNHNSGKFVFSHLMNFMPKHDFDQCVLCHGGNYRTPSFLATISFYVWLLRSSHLEKVCEILRSA
jgi:hypothetical protein